MRIVYQTEGRAGVCWECEVGMMSRNQKMGDFEEDIILYYGDNGEPLNMLREEKY